MRSLLPLVRPDSSFEPEKLEAMQVAFDMAKSELLSRKPNPPTDEAIAKIIIATATSGNYSAAYLAWQALDRFSANQKTA